MALSTISIKTHRQRQKEATKALILETAYTLFAHQGYERTTMRLLAQEAGVGLGTIFKHFPDKPSLLVAAYMDDLGQVLSEALRTLPRAGLLDQLFHITRALYSFYAADPAFSKVLLKESIFLDGEHGQILDGQFQSFLNGISSLLGEAAANRELNEKIDLALATMAYGSLYFSTLVMALKKPKFQVDTESRFVISLFRQYLSSQAR
jgi:AcrR family transcriptional regulator